MREFNKDIEIIPYLINDVKESELGVEIYKKLIEDLTDYLTIEDGYKLNCLDMWASESYIMENQPEWMTYHGMDERPSFIRNGENREVEISSSPNNIAVKPRTYDIIFTLGQKFGYGPNLYSLPEVERIIKSGGLLIVSLSRYWYFKETSQLIIATRPGIEYIRSIEINYKIIESKIESARYFCCYKFKG